MNYNALVVSVHDVSPRTRDECEQIVSELEEMGVEYCSLLVIPDHHRSCHFLRDQSFCDWLKQRVSKGHEAVIHGYFHQRARRPSETILERLTTRFYTADEGEFFDIEQSAAAALVARAQTEFRQAGIEPDGFIAPAWLLSEQAQQALWEAGCQYTTRLRDVLDLQRGRRYLSQSMVWSVRSGWRRRTSLAWNAALFHALVTNPLLRISIHPVDVHHREIWQQIRHFTERALRNRTPLSYERWVTRQRALGINGD